MRRVLLGTAGMVVAVVLGVLLGMATVSPIYRGPGVVTGGVCSEPGAVSADHGAPVRCVPPATTQPPRWRRWPNLTPSPQP